MATLNSCSCRRWRQASEPGCTSCNYSASQTLLGRESARTTGVFVQCILSILMEESLDGSTCHKTRLDMAMLTKKCTKAFQTSKPKFFRISTTLECPSAKIGKEGRPSFTLCSSSFHRILGNFVSLPH
ncbi:hypothetical protein BDR03DRAFT_940249 [Suillus americanus]|nr:hypothetical protein BDR03DRAFT_940249 [Suillus americanus]